MKRRVLVQKILEGRNIRSLLLNEGVLPLDLDLKKTGSDWVKAAGSPSVEAYTDLQLDLRKLNPAASRASVMPVLLKVEGDDVTLSFRYAKASGAQEAMFFLMAQVDKFLSANRSFAQSKRTHVVSKGLGDYSLLFAGAASALGQSFEKTALFAQNSIASALKNVVSLAANDPKLKKSLASVGFSV